MDKEVLRFILYVLINETINQSEGLSKEKNIPVLWGLRSLIWSAPDES